MIVQLTLDGVGGISISHVKDRAPITGRCSWSRVYAPAVSRALREDRIDRHSCTTISFDTDVRLAIATVIKRPRLQPLPPPPQTAEIVVIAIMIYLVAFSIIIGVLSC